MEAGDAAEAPRPRRRPPDPMGLRALGASLAAHAAIAAVLAMPGFPRVMPAPRAVVPIMVPSAAPTPSPKPRPRARGDLAVRPRAAATPAPTPVPRVTPTPKPSARPSPLKKPSPRPTPSPSVRKDAEEQRRFAQMRTIPYFAKMTDAQLRQQRLPPGLTDWGQVAGVDAQLGALNWLFLPPETGPAASPRPDATATDTLVTRLLLATDTLPVPSPAVSLGPDGMEARVWQSADAYVRLERGAGAGDARVIFRPDPLGLDSVERSLTAPWDPDPAVFWSGVLERLRALASPGPSPDASASSPGNL